MYQVSDHTRSQFEKMLGLASVKEALALHRGQSAGGH